MTASGSGYPIQLALPQERAVNRWWGLLWFGMLVRAILAIPHLIVLLVLYIVLGIGFIVVWIPILIFGKTPALWCTLATEVVQRTARVGAYMFLFPGAYPALGMGASGPVDLTVDVGDRKLSRLWGIPYFGFLVREIVLIPQIIVLFVLGIVIYVLALVVWIPILVNGRYAEMAMSLVGKYIRYSSRVTAYLLFLPVPWPPIADI